MSDIALLLVLNSRIERRFKLTIAFVNEWKGWKKKDFGHPFLYKLIKSKRVK